MSSGTFAIAAEAVLAQFGRRGRRLQQLARGRDERPVRPYRPRPVARVARRLDGPVSQRPILQALTRLQADELAARLRARGQAGQELRLILGLENGGQGEAHFVLRRPTSDPVRLARTLQALLASVRVDCGVVRVEVVLAGLVPASGQQLDLFHSGAGQAGRLQDLLPDLLARYGPDCFHRVAVTDAANLLLERRVQLRPAGGR